MQPERGIEGTRPPAGGKKSPVGSFLVFGSQSSGMSTVVADVQVYILFDPYGNCNNDDRCLRQKQGVIVGAVASETRAPPEARSGCWEPQPGRAAACSAVSNQPSGLLLSPRVQIFRNVYRGYCRFV